MNPPKQHFLDLAVAEAQKSARYMRVGCVIYKGKAVIAKGYNRASSQTKDIPMKYLKWRGSLHAEMAAIFSALEKKKSLSGATLLVVRINNRNQLRLARPCRFCSLGILELTSIKKVFYSVAEYPYVCQLPYEELVETAQVLRTFSRESCYET